MADHAWRHEPWSQGVSKIIGAAQVMLRDSEFGHMFEKEGFIGALPEGIAPGLAEDRPLLESAESGQDGLWGALETKSLPWQAFALLETEIPEMTARLEDTG